MRIAAYVDPHDDIIDLKTPGIVRFYENIEGVWVSFSEFPLSIKEANDLKELQLMLKPIAEELDDGHIFLAGEIGGVPGVILESVGLKIWRSDHGPVIPELEYIMRKELEAMEALLAHPPKPVAVGSECAGKFRVNLIEVLKTYPHLNSREVLIPFLTETQFGSLEIICEHAPKWFETELNKMNVMIKSKTLDPLGMKVVLCPSEGMSGCSGCAPSDISDMPCCDRTRRR